MRRLLHCPSLAYFAFALISLGCSKEAAKTVAPAAILKAEQQTETSITKEWIRDVGYRPLISGQISRESTINKDLSCVQWVKLSNGSISAEALEFHHAACPNDEIALGETSLSFRLWVTESETADWGSTHTLFQLDGEIKTDVGQVQLSQSAGARLEEVCQFTNQATEAKFSKICTVSEVENSWGVVTLISNPSPTLTSEPQETEEELARR